MLVWVLNTPLEDSLSNRYQKPIIRNLQKMLLQIKNYYEYISDINGYIYIYINDNELMKRFNVTGFLIFSLNIFS